MSLNYRNIDDLLLLKPNGVFEIQDAPKGRSTITVYRPGQLEEVIFCVSPGHANQVRQELTDQGMCGLNGGAL